MKLEIIKLADLKPLEKNVRRHNEKQIKELQRSLDQFGQTRAIIVDEKNNILIGNGLFIAMRNRGDETAECSRVLGLSETQKKKLILTDNKIYSLGVDDYENITAFINDITLDGDFDIAGFDEEVVREMTRELNEVNTDVMSYGTIPENYITPSTQAQAETTPQPLQRPQETPVVQSKEEAQTPATAVAEIKNDRTIICPNCGEVIHLD